MLRKNAYRWVTVAAVMMGLPAVLIGLSAPPASAQPGTSQADAAFFNEQVLPVLEDNCYACHSHEDDEMRAGLVVDSLEGLLQGGISGPAIVPESPDQSLLIQLIRGQDEDRPMPPNRLMTPAEISVLEEWVRRGAPDPRALQSAEDYKNPIWEKAEDHWAFQPVQMPHRPQVDDPAWAKSTLDLFILSKLEARNLKPAPEADAYTLIRRAYFDLIGLPPTMAQVQAFKTAHAKNADQAMRDLVDELLASPHYGERWGRHWLDLARYADVSGAQPNRGLDTRLPFAYTYRDYVIRAFNDDKPYDDFIKEQLAADQLRLRDKRDLAAMGFLSVGSYAGTREDVIAERIDVTTKVFLGLTVACARCHDHKFDPIPTADFYALHGVFNSSRELGTGFRADQIDPGACPIIEDNNPPQVRAALEAEIAEIEAELAAFDEAHWGPKEALWAAQRGDYLRLATLTKQSMEGLDARTYLKKHHPDKNYYVYQDWRRLTAKGFRKYDPVWSPWRAFVFIKPDEWDRRAPQMLAALDTMNRQRGLNPLLINALKSRPLNSMEDVVQAYLQTFDWVDRQWAQARKRRPDQPRLSDPAQEQIRLALYGEAAPGRRNPTRFNQIFGNQLEGKRNRIVKKLYSKQFHDERAPARAMIVQDVENPRDSHIFIRGEANQRGELVPRRNLTILGGDEGEPFSRGSGRLELAQAIASPKSPLTARVMVNRIWQHHFGQPLVDSPSDFGLQVDEPEHAALLDWLATVFVKRGWSIKQMHREIMTSATWRQASGSHPHYHSQHEVDPDNLLFWRQNMRRLEFEPIRDALLHVCGTLDRTVYGRSEQIFNSPRATRRSVYAYIDRFNQPELMATFDLPDPQATAEQRFVTTVAPQALFMMNSAMVRYHVNKLMGSDEWKALTTADQRIDWLYARAFQREATDRERRVIKAFVAELQQDAQETAEANKKLKRPDRQQIVAAWPQAVQMILMTNEMVYVP